MGAEEGFLNYVLENIPKKSEFDQRLKDYWSEENNLSGGSLTKTPPPGLSVEEWLHIRPKNKNESEKRYEAEQKIKNILSKAFSKGEKIGENCEWTVKAWGGINKVNSDDKKRMVRFVKHLKGESCQLEEDDAKYISFSERVSSFSKIAYFVKPKEFFIYDSRVAYCLNIFILEYYLLNKKKKKFSDIGIKFFSIPGSQGKWIDDLNFQTARFLLNLNKEKKSDEYSYPFKEGYTHGTQVCEMVRPII